MSHSTQEHQVEDVVEDGRLQEAVNPLERVGEVQEESALLSWSWRIRCVATLLVHLRLLERSLVVPVVEASDQHVDEEGVVAEALVYLEAILALLHLLRLGLFVVRSLSGR
eukprot:765289-Hanusia_phi.AAC.5